MIFTIGTSYHDLFYQPEGTAGNARTKSVTKNEMLCVK